MLIFSDSVAEEKAYHMLRLSLYVDVVDTLFNSHRKLLYSEIDRYVFLFF